MDKNFFESSIPSQKEPLDPAAFDYTGWRGRFISVVLRVSSILGIALLLIAFPTAAQSDRILYLVLYAILLAVTYLPSPYWLRAGVLLGLSYAIGLNALLSWGVWVDATLFFLQFVGMAALFFDRRVDVFALLLSILTILLVAVLTSAGILTLRATTAPPISGADWAIFELDFTVLGTILISAIHLFKREFGRVTEHSRAALRALLNERSQLETRIQARTQELERKTIQLNSSTSIARMVAEIQNAGELMNAVVTLTAERFGASHAGLYLLDEKRKVAYLQAASSEQGRKLIGQGIRLEDEKRDAIRQVIKQGKAHLELDHTDAARPRDDHFPNTRSRMTLPLAVRGNLIGILDLHSERAGAFTPEDADVFQSLADLIAVSIDNVRLLNDTRALIEQLEMVTSIQSFEAWKKFAGRHKSAYQYTPAGVRPIFSPSRQDENDGLSIPLELRGKPIGRLTLRRKGLRSKWSERERDIVEKIASQVVLALDNSRLVEEAQKNAQRDQVIAALSNRVRETLDVEAVLRYASIELKRIFDLKEAEISIGSASPGAAISNAPDNSS